jgi:hypothetical protein
VNLIKLVKNEGGRPKGVTQLVNFTEDITKGRYESILGTDISKYILYPVLVTTDFTFNLPVVYSIIASRFEEILKDKNIESFRLNIQRLTMIDLDSLIKFQDLFIEKKLTINHVLNDYQSFLSKGTNSIDKSLSFHKYIHLKTSKMKYDTPRLFWAEVKESLFNGDTQD